MRRWLGFAIVVAAAAARGDASVRPTAPAAAAARGNASAGSTQPGALRSCDYQEARFSMFSTSEAGHALQDKFAGMSFRQVTARHAVLTTRWWGSDIATPSVVVVELATGKVVVRTHGFVSAVAEDARGEIVGLVEVNQQTVAL